MVVLSSSIRVIKLMICCIKAVLKLLKSYEKVGTFKEKLIYFMVFPVIAADIIKKTTG
jgi:hypothetical protein